MPTHLDSPLLGMFGHAVAVGDVDGDGWQDLFVGTFADRPESQYQVRGGTGPSPDRLLLGGPDGFRVDPSFPAMYGRTTGAVFADLDADGDLDLVVTRSYKDVPRGREPTQLLRNDGGKLSVLRTLATQSGGRGIGVLDYDRDGRLDLFIANDRFTAGNSSVLLHNDGGLSFTDATAAAGVPGGLQGFGVATADLNGDGWTDLVIAGVHPLKRQDVTGPGARVLVSDRAGHFRETSNAAFPWTTFDENDDVTSVAVADLNRDGLPDVVLGQHYVSTVPPGSYPPPVVQGRSVAFRVYLHRGVDAAGAPSFEDVTAASGIPAFATKVPNVEIADVDNDGWPDLLTSVSAGNGTTPAVFRNRGPVNGVPRFEVPAGLGNRLYWITATTADFDRDGRLDAMMVHFEPEEASRLFLNRTTAGQWLRVEVDGPGRGVGSVVEVYCLGRLGDPAALVGRREVEALTGYAAGVPGWTHFGLGGLTSVDVRVRPPRGGAVVDRPGVAAGQTLRVAPSGPATTTTTTTTTAPAPATTTTSKPPAATTTTKIPATTTTTKAPATTTTTKPPASTTTIPPSGGTTYVSDLAPTSATNGYGPYERDRTNGGTAAGDGGPIRIRGTVFPKGLGVVPASSIAYDLHGAYASFRADVGIDDVVAPRGSVVFQVWVDNVKVYDSGTVTGARAPVPVLVDVSGKSVLRLVVTNAGDGTNYDHADWAGARLLR